MSVHVASESGASHGGAWINLAIKTAGNVNSSFIHSLTIMKLIQNNKGGTKLLHEGYGYTKKNKLNTTIRWDCAMAATIMLLNERVEPPTKHDQTRELQDKLCNICKDCCDGRKTLQQNFKGIGHCIRWK